ncbi:MAG: sulfatase-like hydrolase/transferase [Leptospira sp.]|nr:sulfatase-like hydrolase/transferase [Leptospira sp.]
MEVLPALTFFRKVILPIFFYSLFFYLFFLLFNTSFHIMGVDVSDYLKQYLGAFFGVYVKSTFLVFSASLVFHLHIGLLFFFAFAKIKFDQDKNYKGFESIEFSFIKIKIKFLILLFAYLLIVDVLGFLHSIILYPQVYGEFFYFRHTWAVNLLYFFTDHFSPLFFKCLIAAIFLFQVLLIFLKLYEKKNKLYLFITLHIIISFVLHQNGLLYLSLLYFLSLPLFQSILEKIHFRTYFLSIPFFCILIFFPFLFDTFSGFLTSRVPNKPPIFIISADSLRYDKLGFVSKNENITPNIDSFAKDSVVFHDHHTTIPRTFPSWADLLTGQYSMSHKIRDMFPSKEEQNRIGRTPFTTIPQFLKKIGYESFAIGGFAADIFPRANFGFDEVLAPNFNARIMTVQRTAESQLFLLPVLTGSFFGGGFYVAEIDGLSSWGDGSRLVNRFNRILRREGDAPYFITYFSSVVHFPYSPPYPYYKKFTDPNYYGKYKFLKFVDPSVSEKPSDYEIKQIRSLFDSSVNAFDSEFGEIIQSLKSKHLYDEAIIIVTADHGEALYEDIHGQGHGEHLRGEAVTKVPLLIKFPKSSEYSKYVGNDIQTITSSVDIFPTLLEFFHLPSDVERPGKSLLSIIRNEIEPDRVVYSETGIWFSDKGDHFFQKQRIPYPNILQLHQVVAEEDFQIMITDKTYQETIAFAKHRSVQNSHYKLIYIPTRKGVIFELYDRNKDPLNQTNIYPFGSVGIGLRNQLFSLVKQWENASEAGDYLLPGTLRNSDL